MCWKKSFLLAIGIPLLTSPTLYSFYVFKSFSCVAITPACKNASSLCCVVFLTLWTLLKWFIYQFCSNLPRINIRLKTNLPYSFPRLLGGTVRRMVSALAFRPDRAVQVRALAGDIELFVFLDQIMYSQSASLHPGEQMSTGEFKSGCNPAMD